MSIPEDRFRELRQAMDAQSDDEPITIERNGVVRATNGTPGQSVVLRDPNGEYGRLGASGRGR